MGGPLAFLLFPILVGAIAFAQRPAVQVAAPIPVNWAGPAGNVVPILLKTQDYEGPFDPLDPQGEKAAKRRALKVAGKLSLDHAASYIPPGAVEMLVKDLKTVLVNEGKRFVLHHPVEATELAGIGTRLLGFLKNASNKVKAEGKKELKEQHH